MNIKLGETTREDIVNALTLGKKYNVKVFIMDELGLRAKTDEAFIFLLKENKREDLEFESLCITKVPEFNKRLSLVQDVSNDNFNIEVVNVKKIGKDREIVSKLALSGGGTYIEIGCSDAEKYRMFKKFNDPVFVEFVLDEAAIKTISGFGRVLQNKNKVININGVDGDIAIIASDIDGDTGTSLISQTPTFINGERDFSFKFRVPNILPTLRGENVKVSLTERGIYVVEELGTKVIILPENMSGG